MSWPEEENDTIERAVTGFLVGTFVAGLFGAFVVFVWFINGGSLNRPGDQLEISLGIVLLGYFLWGPPVGLIVGIVFPRTHSQVGAAAVGAFVMATLYLVFGYFMMPDPVARMFFVVLGVIMGGIGGIIVFGRHWKNR